MPETDKLHRLAIIREKNLLRSEVPEAPEWAHGWSKWGDGLCCWSNLTGAPPGEGMINGPAPDYRPEEPGPIPITLAIVEDT